MKFVLRRFWAFIFCLLVLTGLSIVVSAEETQAKDITDQVSVTGSGYKDFSFLTDKDTLIYRTSGKSCTLTLTGSAPIGSLYLLFDAPYEEYTITDPATGSSITAGTAGYLHEYVDLSPLGSEVTSLTLEFSHGSVQQGEVYVFSPGQVPEFVQRWQPPLEGGADILLFATHSDDDQLFFAGLFPLYARELGYRVQVAYMTDHREDDLARSHEVLNGLWITGATNYPVFGEFPDFRIDDLAQSYAEYLRRGYSEEDLLRYVVAQIRRFDPLVVLGHDFKGEYGHGMHRVYADLLTRAVEVSADETVFPDQVSAYGVWDVPKTYLHLYPENRIVMDWDQPLERFGGMTAFEVTQKRGFPCHVTQQYDLYVNWLYGGGGITRADQIEQWNPCKYGLYRTTVGEDVEKNDLMEHLTSYGEVSRRSEEQDQQLRNTVLLAKTRNASEPQLLRPAAESVAMAAETRAFPAFAAVTAILAAAALAWILYKIKILQKK